MWRDARSVAKGETSAAWFDEMPWTNYLYCNDFSWAELVVCELL